jgi:hypothetical protein
MAIAMLFMNDFCWLGRVIARLRGFRGSAAPGHHALQLIKSVITFQGLNYLRYKTARLFLRLISARRLLREPRLRPAPLRFPPVWLRMNRHLFFSKT